ncbi:alpha/beta fold hydrolase [Streptomyces werraensis]|uniref:alpha/beta fold hydrolase n=1 Tax=Streptomyces werraensis TaxID=68284 RepID=UPI001CE385CC
MDDEDPTDLHLSDAVDAVVKHLEDNDLRNVTLVAHSWGGFPATGATHRVAERLRKVVYWSAFVPAAGRSLCDEIPPEAAAGFAQLADASPNTTIPLPFEVWQSTFMNDAPEPVQRTAHALLSPQPFRYFTETVESFDLSSGIPVSYILSSDDLALPHGAGGPGHFAERLGTAPVLIPGSHEGCFTQPSRLTEAILAV